MIVSRKAITLVEMSVAIVVAFILLYVVLNIFSSGMKESKKALTHQDNMETANILMSQIEYDLLKANEIEIPNWNEEGKSARWFYKSNSSLGKISFSYDHTPNSSDGVHRVVEGNNIKEDNHFAWGHPVNIKFTHMVVNSEDPQNNTFIENHGMWVELEVGSPKGDVATFTMKRLINLNH